MSDSERGKVILRYFYDRWKGYAGAFGISFEQLVTILKTRRPMGGEVFITGLADAVKNAEIPESKVKAAMENLAAASQGKIPGANGDFFNALNGVAINYNFVDAASFVAVESAKDIAKGAQSIGNQVILTGKILNFLLPVAGLFIAGYWIYRLTKGARFGLSRKG